MLQFALRLGRDPRQVVTTTPQNVGALKAILNNPTTVVTQAPTEANRAYLAASFLEEVRTRYGGTRLGRQELEGLLIEDVEGALWTTATIDGCRSGPPEALSRIVVAVDPPVSGHESSDECGIVVVGVLTEGPFFPINGGTLPTGMVLDSAGRLIHTTQIGPTVNGISTAGVSSWIP